MWQDADVAAVGSTRAVARAARAAPHPSTWALVIAIGLGVLLALFWLVLAALTGPQPPRRESDDDHGSGPGGGGPGRGGPGGVLADGYRPVAPRANPRDRRSSVATIADRRTPAPAGSRHTRRALSAARGHLQKSAVKLLGCFVFGYLLLKLVPDLMQALRSLEHVSWEWVLGALALEVLSEVGYVTSWRAIVGPEKLLGRDRRGVRVSMHAAWAQLGGGMVVPGGSLASIGVGTWILRRFGMPGKTIAERQFNLSFLNTAVDALALIVFGVGLAIGIFAGASSLLLTLLSAALAASGIGAVLLIARGATGYSKRVESDHLKLASAIASVSSAAVATEQIVFHRDRGRGLLGVFAYLGFDALVLWTAYGAIHSHPAPGFAVVVMAYIIGARVHPPPGRDWSGWGERRDADPLRCRAQSGCPGGADL